MFLSTHAIETFQINGLLKAAQELVHSKIFSIKNKYLKPDENNLYMNEEEMRFNNIQFKDIFEYGQKKIKRLINKKRKHMEKKNIKNKTKKNVPLKDESASSSNSFSENEDNSLYDDVFKYDLILQFRNLKQEEDKVVLN